MTLPSNDEIQRRADQFGRTWYQQFERSARALAPPSPFLAHLGQIVDPAVLVDLFWSPGETDDHDVVSGRVVAVTERAVLDASFTGVPSEYFPGDRPPGEAEVLTFRKAEVTSVRWKAPRLIRPPGSLDGAEILVSAPKLDWQVELPTARVYGGAEGYFTRVLQAFGLEL